MPEARDHTGRRYGRLTAIEFVEIRRSGSQSKRCWRCRCDCGREVVIDIGRLTTGRTRSCGCLLKEALTSHGGSKDPVYKVWHAMIERCRNANLSCFKDYGGRGIVVCDRWKDFALFLADMGHPPKGGTLERIDVNGNYEPSNCRWATAAEQANNRRNNRRISFNGRDMTVAEWAREAGLHKQCLLYRLNAGWSFEDAISSPSDRTIQRRSSVRLLRAEQQGPP